MYIYVHIYAIMKAMCSPSYHHNGFMATHAFGHVIYGYNFRLRNPILVQCCISKPLENTNKPKLSIFFHRVKKHIIVLKWFQEDKSNVLKLFQEGENNTKEIFFWQFINIKANLFQSSILFLCPWSQKTKRVSDVFRDIHTEMEHCQLVDNHGMLATVINKQNWNNYIWMISVYL